MKKKRLNERLILAFLFFVIGLSLWNVETLYRFEQQNGRRIIVTTAVPPKTRHDFIIAASTYSSRTVRRQDERQERPTSSLSVPYNNNDNETTSIRPTENEFACAIDDDDDDDESGVGRSNHISSSRRRRRRRRTRKLLLMFVYPRTGSTLLVDHLERVNYAATDEAFDIICTNELFSPYLLPYWKVRQPLIVMSKICSLHAGGTTNVNSTTTTSSDEREEWIRQYKAYFDQVKQSTNWTVLESFLRQTPWSNRLLDYEANALEKPRDLLRLLKHVPTESEQGYLTFKVFDYHIYKYLNMTSVQSFLELILQVWDRHDITILVLWRRHLMESFVSLKIAESKSQFLGHASTESDAVYVNRTQLEAYIRSWFRFYKDLQDGLAMTGLPYQVIEYNRDLVDPLKQNKTVERLMDDLGIPRHGLRVKRFQEFHSRLTKQAQVSVEQQVLNWDHVQEWGYANEVAEWDEAFFVGPADGTTRSSSSSNMMGGIPRWDTKKTR